MKSNLLIGVVAASQLWLVACYQYTRPWALPSPPASVPTLAAPPVVGSTGPKLMIFGGQGHKTYLGCLNCSEYAADSVFNSYGSHGSAYSTESILNHFSPFGSEYSTYGACNDLASDPPVVVDGNGAFYGRLTVNTYNSQGFRNERVMAWLVAACKS